MQVQFKKVWTRPGRCRFFRVMWGKGNRMFGKKSHAKSFSIAYNPGVKPWSGYREWRTRIFIFELHYRG